MPTTNTKRPSKATSQPIHVVGESELQNTEDSIKFVPPTQATNLGPLDDDEPVVWQIDGEVGLPVVSNANYFGEMNEVYGLPEMRKTGRTITLPKPYTKYAHDGGHSEINFTREDVLGFFAPESKITNDFPRIYIGTFDDYQELAKGVTRIVWGKPYERTTFTPTQQKHVRDIYIACPEQKPFRITRPATEGWVNSKKLLSEISRDTTQYPSRGTADDD